MKTPWWLWPNVLGLDAPVIALVWQEAFALALGATLSWPERAVLFLVVWCVYAGDRVADGWRLGASAEASARHRFALRHRGGLLVGIALACAAVLALVRFLPARILPGGMVLGGAVGVYFLWNQFAGARLGRSWAKESLIGIFFAAGCVLPAWRGRAADLIPAGLFAAICTANCLLISRLERERDIRRGEASLAVRLPPHTRPAQALAAAAGLGALGFVAMRLWPALNAALALSAAGLWCGILVERRLGAQAAGVWADVALLSPALFFLL